MGADDTGDEGVPQWEPACKVSDDDLRSCGAALRAIACASDIVVAASSRPALKVWKVAQAKLTSMQALAHGAVGSSCVEVSGNGQVLLACSDDGSISLWDLRERRRASELSASIPTAWTAKFLIDGYRIASAGPSGSVCLWDLRVGRLETEIAALSKDEPEAKKSRRDKGTRALPEPPNHRKQAVGIYSLALSADGRLLSCGRGSGDVGLLRLEDQTWVADLNAHRAESAAPVRALGFDATSRLLLSGGDDSHVCVMDAATLVKNHPATVDAPKLERFAAHRGWVTSLGVCPDPARKVLLTTSWDATVKLWDYRTHRLLRTYREHTESVFACAFQPVDGHFFVSAGADANVALYTAKGSADETALVPLTTPS